MTFSEIKIALILICLTLCPAARAQQAKTHRDSLRQDLAFARTLLDRNYPSLYRYASKRTIDRAFARSRRAVTDSTTLPDFLKEIKSLLSLVKDGHLYSGFSPDVTKQFEGDSVFFPLQLQFIGHHTFVSETWDDDLQVGAELISLNGQRMDRIRKKLFRYIIADGYIATKKYTVLNNAFQGLYRIVYGRRGHFAIQYKVKNGPLKARDLKPLPRRRKAEPVSPLLQLSFRDSAAVLAIRSFEYTALQDAHLDFPRFIDSSFMELKKRHISRLIIDLRDNGGGRDLYGSLLYAYLTDRPFPVYKALMTATRNIPPQFIGKHTSFRDLSPNAIDSLSAGHFRLWPSAHDNLQTVQPNPNHYDGRLWVLINGRSFSATSEVCAIIKSSNRGRFIGEETGGTYSGTTAGIMYDTLLPNTKIEFSFGMIKYINAVRKVRPKGRGIMPDYAISPTIDDVLAGRDLQMELALRLARRF